MNIVAHQDDDILFMNPDIQREIEAGNCVRTVYLTAGDGGHEASYWRDREAGSEAAYLQMLTYAGFDTVQDTYTEQTLPFVDTAGAAHQIITETPTQYPNVTLIFLRLPDGSPSGRGTPRYGFSSLTHLWVDASGSVATSPPGTGVRPYTITSVDGANVYSEVGLVSTLAKLMGYYQPQRVQIQDDQLLPYVTSTGLEGTLFGAYCNGANGPPATRGPHMSVEGCSVRAKDQIDHADHIAGAHFAEWASEQYAAPHTLASYEDDPVDTQPPAFDGAGPALDSADPHEIARLRTLKVGTWLAYLSHDPALSYRCGQGGVSCAGGEVSHNGCQMGVSNGCTGGDEIVNLWLSREHVVSTTQSDGPDMALTAAATASGQIVGSRLDQSPANLVDGVPGGAPFNPNTAWAARGGVGTWANLHWDTGQTVDKVVLYGLGGLPSPGGSELVITSSGGSTTIPVGPLIGDGAPTPVVSPTLSGVTDVRYVVTGGAAPGGTVGLGEIQVYDSAG